MADKLENVDEVENVDKVYTQRGQVWHRVSGAAGQSVVAGQIEAVVRNGSGSGVMHDCGMADGGRAEQGNETLYGGHGDRHHKWSWHTGRDVTCQQRRNSW